MSSLKSVGEEASSGHARRAERPATREPVYFEDGSVYVSRSRVVVRGTTYAVNGVTSTRLVTIPKKTGCLRAGIKFVITALFVMWAGGAAGIDGLTALGFLILMIGAALIAVHVRFAKDACELVLGVAGREEVVLAGSSRDYVGGVARAINDALASR